MTITLSATQEKAVRDAIRAGQIASVEDLIERAIADLARRSSTGSTDTLAGKNVFAQGLGLFGSAEDAAILDEVVSVAYAERRQPSKRHR